MAKFKEGDKVRAKEHYRMISRGWKGRVIEIVDNCLIWVRPLDDERGPSWRVEAKYFDLIDDQKKIVITTDGKTTTAALFDGKNKLKSAKAVCAPEDEFDFTTGAKIAFERLTGSEPVVKPKELLRPGLFGRDGYGWFIVTDETFAYEDGMFTYIKDYDCMLKNIVRPEIPGADILIEAACFNLAKKRSGTIIWERK